MIGERITRGVLAVSVFNVAGSHVLVDPFGLTSENGFLHTLNRWVFKLDTDFSTGLF